MSRGCRKEKPLNFLFHDFEVPSMRSRSDSQDPNEEAGREPDEAAPAPPRPPYQVGYKRPPRDGQFKKGRSGNPAGRPKASHTLISWVKKYAKKTRQVRIGENYQTLTYDQIILMQLQAKAQRGNARATTLWLELHQAAEALDEPVDEGGGVVRLPSSEFKEFTRLQAEARRKKSEQGDGP